MRRNTTKDHEKPLARKDLGGPDIPFETVDSLVLRARQMRAEATADLLSRLGAAMVRRLRPLASSRRSDLQNVVNGGSRRAV